jgi:hypothetical protein
MLSLTHDWRRLLNLKVLAVFAVMSMTSTAHSGPASDAVRFFYTPVGYEPEAGLRDRFVDPAKSIFDQNDKMTETEEMGCIDFVLAIDGQDFDQAELDRTLKLTEKVAGDSAEVTATFELFPKQADSAREIVWSLKKVGNDWKVADIQSITTDWKLSEFDCGGKQ